jgi:hypothetical protein
VSRHFHAIPCSKDDCPDRYEELTTSRQLRWYSRVTGIMQMALPPDARLDEWGTTERYVAYLYGVWTPVGDLPRAVAIRTRRTEGEPDA